MGEAIRINFNCENYGAEQNWGEGVTVGEGTVIEVADRAVFCQCGAGVEEENAALIAVQANTQ